MTAVGPVAKIARVRATPWRARAGLLWVLGGCFAARWPFRHAPLIRDEGEYAHLGQAILAGVTPYLDVYNQKTPLVFYGMATLQAVAGEALATLRVATTLYGLATALVLWLVARRLFDARAALVAVLAFCVMTFDQAGVVHSASCEFFGLLWSASTLALWYCGGARAALLAGVCAGLAYQTKQSGVVLPIFLVADAAWLRLQGARRPLQEPACALAGFVAVLAITLAWFASQGALGAYWTCTWTNNFAYVGARQAPWTTLATRVVSEILRVDLGLWVLGAAGLAGLAATRPTRRGSGLWLLLVGSVALALLGGNLSSHYYLPAVVPLALGVGFATTALWDRARSQPRARLALVALLALPWLAPARHAARTLRSPEQTLERVFATLTPALEAPRVARHLAERTEPDEPILVVGSEPQIYFHARRPAASRMVFTYPLTGPYRFAPELRREFLDAIGPEGARYVVLVNQVHSLASWPAPAQRLVSLVRPLLRESYVEETRFPAITGARQRNLMTVYRRKDAP